MIRIYIDTNVFLDFYQSATDRMGIFHELRARVDCIVVPEQTVREFRRNRAVRLIHLADQVEKSANVNVHTTAIVRELPDFKKWVEARDAVKNHSRAIATQLRTWARDESSDPVYQEFVKLYVHGMTMSTPREALAKAQKRKLLGDPPTTPDKYTVGDEVIWETLLALCDDDLIIVSRDRTFLDNESLLRSEYKIDGKRQLLAVTDSLSHALKLVGKPSPPIEQAEKDDVQREANAEKALETGRCPKCNVEMEEEGYEGSDGDEAWWLTCPKCSLLAFPTKR
jgi:predicted nucleic acid-binding protein